MAFTDKTLTCVDCGASFTFTARDQEFHASKGFANEPKRCFNCRQQRRVQRGDAPAATSAGGGQTAQAAQAAQGPRPQRQPVYTGPRARGTTATPDRPGGRRDGGRPRGRRDGDRDGRNGRSGGDGDSGERSFDGGPATPVSYTAPCAMCGKDTPVSASAGSQVVLCPDCYSKMTAIASS